MKHVSEISIAIIIATIIFAIAWWEITFSDKDYEIKPKTERQQIEWIF